MKLLVLSYSRESIQLSLTSLFFSHSDSDIVNPCKIFMKLNIFRIFVIIFCVCF